MVIFSGKEMALCSKLVLYDVKLNMPVETEERHRKK